MEESIKKIFIDAIGLRDLLLYIDKVDDNTSNGMQRARFYFTNGHQLSVVRGELSYGGPEGLFEIMPSDEGVLEDEDDATLDVVCGHLTTERVLYYINKIARMEP
jgi:hypothetical protein